jgi:hypothetical protein
MMPLTVLAARVEVVAMVEGVEMALPAHLLPILAREEEQEGMEEDISPIPRLDRGITLTLDTPFSLAAGALVSTLAMTSSMRCTAKPIQPVMPPRASILPITRVSPSLLFRRTTI